MAETKYGFVYMLAHPCMPGIYKIGCTERAPHQRMQELSRSTSVPCDFQMLCYIEVEDPFGVEAQIHRWIAGARINPDREFFQPKDIRKLAGILKYHDEALSFTEICLGEYLEREAYENGWDSWEVINPFIAPPTPPAAAEGAQEAPTPAANDEVEAA